MSTPLSPEDANAVQILFTGELRTSNSLTSNDYLNMASYLKQIHDCYYPFYEGISPFHTDVAQRVLLPCMIPIIGLSSSQLEWQYTASSTDAAALKGLRDILMRRLSLLNGRTPLIDRSNVLGCFHYYGMPVIDIPEQIKTGSCFTELYPNYDAFKASVTEVQLWLHFFDLFCDLLATMIPCIDLGEIDIAAVRGSKLIRAAHSFHISRMNF